MRRRRWKAPNNPTAAARQVWKACYPHRPWPKGWRVKWVGFIEFVHVNAPELRHGLEFDRLTQQACARIGLTLGWNGSKRGLKKRREMQEAA